MPLKIYFTSVRSKYLFIFYNIFINVHKNSWVTRAQGKQYAFARLNYCHNSKEQNVWIISEKLWEPVTDLWHRSIYARTSEHLIIILS